LPSGLRCRRPVSIEITGRNEKGKKNPESFAMGSRENLQSVFVDF
jgi:hypothetical protein